ncbi:hypothetical protein ACQ4PT_059830 [Festuca glaucescens]
MAWEEEELEEEHEEEMEASEDEEDVVVGQMPTFMVPKHINKRALKNKALSVSLDKKALKDFVTGFHKRKKKRRKEANKITEEKERRKRIEARKKRKEEKEIALYGKVLSSSDTVDAEDGDGMDEDLSAPAPEIKTYEDGGTRITVVTSEITHEDDDLAPRPASTSYAKKNPSGMAGAKKNPSLGVKKQKPPPKRQYKKNKSKSKKVDTSRRKNKGKN